MTAISQSTMKTVAAEVDQGKDAAIRTASGQRPSYRAAPCSEPLRDLATEFLLLDDHAHDRGADRFGRERIETVGEFACDL
jgi:hypothetical protein